MATLKQIAKTAGVSIRTVTRVLNNAPHISEPTRHKVQLALDMLEYTPNLLARSLKNKKKNLLGIIAANLDVPVLNRKMVALQHEADRYGKRTLIGLTEGIEEKQDRFVREFMQFCDGLLFLQTPSVANRTRLKEKGYPYVLVDSYLTGEPAVSIDRAYGILEAIRECHRHYESFTFLTSDPNPLETRQNAFNQGTLKLARGKKKTIIGTDHEGLNGGYQAGDRVFNAGPALVMCYSDRLAAGLMRRLYELNARIPEDFGIVGFDDDEYGEYMYKPLTTVSQSVTELALKSLAYLDSIINGNPAARQETVKTRFIPRATTL